MRMTALRTARAEGARAQQDDTLSAAGEAKEETGDVLVDAPIDAGLVEVDADGNLKASQALTKLTRKRLS